MNTHRDLREAEYSAFLLDLKRIGPKILEPEIACCLELGAMTFYKRDIITTLGYWVGGGGLRADLILLFRLRD